MILLRVCYMIATYTSNSVQRKAQNKYRTGVISTREISAGTIQEVTK